MLRLWVLVVAAAVLSGCGTGAAERLANDNKSCARYAAERRQDAADNGYGQDIQNQIADRVYVDCQKWDRPIVSVQRASN